MTGGYVTQTIQTNFAGNIIQQKAKEKYPSPIFPWSHAKDLELPMDLHTPYGFTTNILSLWRKEPFVWSKHYLISLATDILHALILSFPIKRLYSWTYIHTLWSWLLYDAAQATDLHSETSKILITSLLYYTHRTQRTTTKRYTYLWKNKKRMW